MSIAHWPPNERPREKLILYGAKNLSDAELLAIFVNTGIRGKNALDIARELLMMNGSLKKLLQCSPHEIYRQRGLGKAKYALLQAALELGRRFLDSDIQVGETLRDSRMTKRFLAHRLKNYSYEVFACLFLDSQNRVICFEELFRGTLHEASVYPREIVKRVLAHNAAKVIFAHNHPSGSADLSDADKDLTRKLVQALLLVDTEVIDHIVIGNTETISFRDHGLL